MTGNRIYLEGGGHTDKLHGRCREGFRKLFQRCGLEKRMPRLVACGGRNQTYDDFSTAHRTSRGAYVAMLVDSEDPVQDINRPWAHLHMRDRWNRPENATDDQVLLMTTCMETWLVADHAALQQHYKRNCLAMNDLPPLVSLERRPRQEVQASLKRATRNCPKRYAKGPASFDILALLNPNTLKPLLPSFERMLGILDNKL